MDELNSSFLDKREAAFFVAVAEWHGTQKRKFTGLSYTTHLLAVAKIVKTQTRNTILVAAALGHDLFEDTNCSENDLLKALIDAGYSLSEAKDIIGLVHELTDVFIKEDYPDINRKLRKQKEAERLGKSSPGAQTIKYADLIDNARDLVVNDPGFCRIFHREMQRILAHMNRGDFTLYAKAMQTWIRVQEQLAKEGPSELINAYLEALGASDLEALLKLFSMEARVFSPRYGQLPADEFFQKLFEDTEASNLRLIQVFESVNKEICAFFHYDWILKSGELISFDVCDIFKLDGDRKITELRIIYSL
ncbi:MAG: hypothetical protein KDC34_15470 [Saprospiraceae bacterium]|nr:hypothetical protein [Saprospiraceae bacterium]